jgi:hypothetical protein
MPNRAPIHAPALSVFSAQPNVSLAAKGLATFLLTRPRRPIPLRELFSSTSDGMPFINAAVRELEAVGMVERVPTRDRDGMKDRGGIQLVQP